MSWFDDNKHVLGSIGMCVLIMQVTLLWCFSIWLLICCQHSWVCCVKSDAQLLWVGILFQKCQICFMSSFIATCSERKQVSNQSCKENMLHWGVPCPCFDFRVPLWSSHIKPSVTLSFQELADFSFWKQVLKITKTSQIMATELRRSMCFKKTSSEVS